MALEAFSVKELIGLDLYCLTIAMVTTLPPTEVGGRRQNWSGMGCGTQRWVGLGSRGGSGA